MTQLSLLQVRAKMNVRFCILTRALKSLTFQLMYNIKTLTQNCARKIASNVQRASSTCAYEYYVEFTYDPSECAYMSVCIFSTLIASGSYVRHIEKLLGAIVGHVPRMRSIKIGFLSDDQCWSNRSDSMTHSGH